MQTQIEQNTEQLTNHILDVVEVFLQEGNKDRTKVFDNYTVTVRTIKDNGEDVVEWDYELSNPEAFPIDADAVLDGVFEQIAYEQ